MSEANKALIRRFVEEVHNQHNIDTFVAPSFVHYYIVAGLPDTREGVVRSLACSAQSASPKHPGYSTCYDAALAAQHSLDSATKFFTPLYGSTGYWRLT